MLNKPSSRPVAFVFRLGRAALVSASLAAMPDCSRAANPPLVSCAGAAPLSAVPATIKKSAQESGFRWVECKLGSYELWRDGTQPLEDGQWRRELARLPGVVTVGWGACCKLEPETHCLAVHVAQGSPGELELPRRLAEVAQQAGIERPRLRVRVDLAPPAAPRCTPGDGSCGPMTYDNSSLCADARRTAAWHRVAVRPTPSRGDPCHHDGDCVSCNAICSRYTHAATACTLQYETDLASAYCGCLEGHCAWFEFRN